MTRLATELTGEDEDEDDDTRDDPPGDAEHGDECGVGAGAFPLRTRASSIPAEALSAAWANTAGHSDPVRSRSQPKRMLSAMQPPTMSARPARFGRAKL